MISFGQFHVRRRPGGSPGRPGTTAFQRRIVLACLALGLAGCQTVNSRIAKQQAVFDQYPPEIQAAIRAGQVEPGFDRTMTRMAFGDPSRIIQRKTTNSTQEVWSYRRTQSQPSHRLGYDVVCSARHRHTSLCQRVPTVVTTEETARIVFQDDVVIEIESLK